MLIFAKQPKLENMYLPYQVDMMDHKQLSCISQFLLQKKHQQLSRCHQRLPVIQITLCQSLLIQVLNLNIIPIPLILNCICISMMKKSYHLNCVALYRAVRLVEHVGSTINCT